MPDKVSQLLCIFLQSSHFETLSERCQNTYSSMPLVSRVAGLVEPSFGKKTNLKAQTRGF